MATKYKQHFESSCSNVVVQIRQPSHRIPNILWSWWSEYSRNFRWDFAQSEFKSRVNEIVHQPRPIKLALVHLAKVHTSRNYPHLQGLSSSCGVTDILFLVSLCFQRQGWILSLVCSVVYAWWTYQILRNYTFNEELSWDHHWLYFKINEYPWKCPITAFPVYLQFSVICNWFPICVCCRLV